MLNKIIRYFLHNIGLGGLLFSNSEEKHQHTTQPEEEQQIWTCSMHPQIRKTEAGKCPICGMDLIPLNNRKWSRKPNGDKNVSHSYATGKHSNFCNQKA